MMPSHVVSLEKSKRYAILVTMVLAFFSFMLLLFSRSWPVLKVATLICAVVAVGALYILITKPRLLRLGWFLGASILFYYIVPAAYVAWENTFFGLGKANAALRPESLSVGIMVVLCVSGLLGLLGSICERGTVPKSTPSLERAHRFVIYAVVAGTGFMYATGHLSLNGIVQQEGGGIPPIASLVKAMCVPISGWAAYNFMVTKNIDIKRPMVLSIIITLLYLVPFGRREILFGLLTTLLGLSIGGLGEFKQIRFRSKVLVTIIAATFVSVSSIFFVGMRIHGYRLNKNENIQDYIYGSYEVVTNRRAEVLRSLRSNVSNRSFNIVSYLSTVAKKTHTAEKEYGGLMKTSLVKATPSLLVGEWKYSFLAKREAGSALGAKNFDLPETDYANSILVAGATDFGILGMLVYPMIIWIIYLSMWVCCNRLMSIPIKLYVILSFVYVFLNVETSLSGYFVHIRNLILSLIVIKVIVFAVRVTGERYA